VHGRPPKCHRCGDRSHKVAQCTAQRSYASATLGMTADDETDDDVVSDNELADEEKLCIVTDDQAPPATPSASANVQSASWAEQVAAERTGELAAEDGVSDRTRPRRSPQSTASGGGGYGDGGAGDASGIEVAAAADDRDDNDDNDVAAFHPPSAHIRRPAKRQRKEKQQMEQQTECLDPTTGRRNSRSTVYSGRRRASEGSLP